LTNVLTENPLSFFTRTHVQTNEAGVYRVVVSNAAVTTSFAENFYVTVLADADTDGLPDVWEAAYGFATNNNADALLDADGDTMSNWAEYIAGTNPTNALSYLKVDWLSGGETVQIQFQAVSNRTYTVQYTEALESGPWHTLMDVLARGTNRLETLVAPAPAPRAYYRLVTPRQP